MDRHTRKGRPTDGWRPQATAAIVCVIAVPWWWVLSEALRQAYPTKTYWRPVEWAGLLTFVAGFAFAIAGALRGSRASRVASVVCLVVLALPVFGCVTLFVFGKHSFG